MSEDNLVERVNHNYLRKTIRGSISLLTFTIGYAAVWAPLIYHGNAIEDIGIPQGPVMGLTFLASVSLGMASDTYIGRRIDNYIGKRFFNESLAIQPNL